MSDNREILDLANRFESIATDGFERRSYRPALADLARRIRERPGLAPRVAHVLGVMIRLIGESDSEGRFASKIAILREAVEALGDD